MAWDNKVVWSEGMFLRPQHFQQFDRYVEALVRGRTAAFGPHPWGLSRLAVNQSLLATGKFAVSECQGVFEDGTPFAIPGNADHPPPLELPENARNVVVYLTLPVQQPGGIEVSGDDHRVARYSPREFEAVDVVAGSESVARLDIGLLRLRYALGTQDLTGYAVLGLARILEVRADRSVVLDPHYIPPLLDCAASPVLSGFIAELQGLLHHRATALAARVAGGAKGVAEIADFLLLQAVNRYEPVMSHFNSVPAIHPERFYTMALQMAGEMATFTAATRQPPNFPPYRHDDLQATFQPVMGELRQSLSAVLEQTAVQLPLQERKYGIHVAPLTDRSLLKTSFFVLAVKADVPGETLRRHFPNQVKIGAVEQIRELVNVALPGIPVRPLPVAPRQIPYHAGVTYFEMDRSNKYWEALANSGGIAVHVSGEFPGLDMALWAIKE